MTGSEKRDRVAEFLFSIAHNFKAVMKPIFQSLLKILWPPHFQYGHGDCEYRTWSKIGRFRSHFGAPPFEARTFLALDFFSGRAYEPRIKLGTFKWW